MLIYAMSDIHGEREAFEDSLSVVDFSGDNMLILCGDYLDRLHNHPEFLMYIMEFQESHNGQVIVLMGNHEAWCLGELTEDTTLIFDDDGEVIPYMADSGAVAPCDPLTREWLSDLPLFYETDNQIFVHAGINEEAGEYWRVGTEDFFFYEKYPQTYGAFPKDIIAGHIGTYQMCNENRVYWDGQAHFYLDGTTEKSKFVPVLKYDTETGRYTSFEKVDSDSGVQRWLEYAMKPGSNG